jgi:hypothetical protein
MAGLHIATPLQYVVVSAGDWLYAIAWLPERDGWQPVEKGV